MCKRFCEARTCLWVQVLLAVIGTCIDRLDETGMCTNEVSV